MTQSCTTVEKPTSLPPIVMLTSVVTEFSAYSWVEMTSPVVAPEQARDTYDAGELALAHSWEYALVLRRQFPLLPI
jgi:hypothetical protein